MPNDGPTAGYQFLGVWSVTTGKRIQLVNCQWRELDFWKNFRISPDGKFATGTHARRDLLWIYDLQKNVAPDFPREAMAPLGFTPGGTLIARMRGQPLRFLDPATFKIIKPPLSADQRAGKTAKSAPPEKPKRVDPPPAKPQLRTWTSSNRKFKIDAVYIGIKDGVVSLHTQTRQDHPSATRQVQRGRSSLRPATADEAAGVVDGRRRSLRPGAASTRAVGSGLIEQQTVFQRARRASEGHRGSSLASASG